MSDSAEIGKTAELTAAKYLKKLGFKILETNYRGHFGEIDIIAKDGKCLVFVEVKYRSTHEHGRPEEFVNTKKQLKIVKTALEYLKSEYLVGAEIRFDVLAIDSVYNEIGLIRAAFESPSAYTY